MAEASSPASPDNSHSDDYGNQGGGDRDNSNVREQDRFLPIANISRIMKKALPANAKIAKDAKETVQECVSEFISFITSEASDKCQREKRKTINGDDLLWAMSTLGFEDYVDPLKVYLHKYREVLTLRVVATWFINFATHIWCMFASVTAGGCVLSNNFAWKTEGDKGSAMNKPGDASSGKKEGAGGPPMSPGVQMGGGAVYGGQMTYMQPQMMAPGGYQMQMQQQMLTAPGNQQL